ncbi:hypothetical protein [Arthrobacter bambusae]|uniref:Uncharacterized protein n=1 Tax=Arthrobacter bambusae TaxID=1338426 RepID=A0AAW8DJF2_9MICC|nr:hypothetical protein [Arthrobacter bambusae]MDP9905634.1 hypothetical protein [Arthrobacter bambusae]MDQ0127284.1 hypothetical protein [Arthrobacter bambusae]MDQ0178626.1 hypothetical protein [Arthrobacter bambusae]
MAGNPNGTLNLSRPGTRAQNSGGLTLGSPMMRGGAASSNPAAAPLGLNVGSGPAHRSPRNAVAVQDHAFPAPTLSEVRALDETNPVVRLNERQSAIGSLLAAGPRSVAWEDEEFTTGALHVDGHSAGAPVKTSGNRPLVGFHGTSGVVSLRHVRQLRRALIIAAEAPLTIGVFGGAAAAVVPRNSEGDRSVLYISRIGPVLEIRVEFVPADASDAEIWAMLGFSMTIPLDQQVLSH